MAMMAMHCRNSTLLKFRKYYQHGKQDFMKRIGQLLILSITTGYVHY